jgi:hypothetical protein
MGVDFVTIFLQILPMDTNADDARKAAADVAAAKKYSDDATAVIANKVNDDAAAAKKAADDTAAVTKKTADDAAAAKKVEDEATAASIKAADNA